jgi:hypothetical protein
VTCHSLSRQAWFAQLIFYFDPADFNHGWTPINTDKHESKRLWLMNINHQSGFHYPGEILLAKNLPDRFQTIFFHANTIIPEFGDVKFER